ncbi:hypothetical protein F3K44_31455 [Bacillus megaterium]|nr:hypothetical protein [Priestia megaterium]
MASKNGYHKSEVDLMIRAYLQGKNTCLKSNRQRKRKKPRAPLQAQPETPISLQKKQRVDNENVGPEKVVEAGPIIQNTEVEVMPEPIQPAITLSRKNRLNQKNNQYTYSHLNQ